MALVWKPLSEATTVFSFETDTGSAFDSEDSTITYTSGSAFGSGVWQLNGPAFFDPEVPAVRLRFTPLTYYAGATVTAEFYYITASGLSDGVQGNESASPETEWLPDPVTFDVYAHYESNEWRIEFYYDTDEEINFHQFYVEIEEDDGLGEEEPSACFWADKLLVEEDC